MEECPQLKSVREETGSLDYLRRRREVRRSGLSGPNGKKIRQNFRTPFERVEAGSTDVTRPSRLPESLSP